VPVRSYAFDSAEDPENSNGTHVPFSKKYLTQVAVTVRKIRPEAFFRIIRTVARRGR
jgi:hypothetical protein